jgi:HD-GYP domain-containing protein (c-di-GMP phosphodiesterase class II)
MAFIPVHLNTLRPGEPVPFDLHLRLSTVDDHYVHYLKKMDPIDLDRFEKLKSKGVKKVFIQDHEEDSYLDYLDKGLDVLEQENISSTEKASLTKDTLNTQAENAERSLENEKAYNRMQGQLGKIVDFFTSDKSALKNVLSASGIAVDTSQHSANVTSLALGIAAKAGITDSKDLLDLGIACLVHDIGLKKLNLPLNASRETLKGEDLKRYMNHSTDGTALLSGKPFITPRVLALVADHEEIGEGRGYPEKKRIEKLIPTSQILNLSNAFDRFCIQKGLNSKDAIDPFFEKHSENFILEHLTILTTVITSK